MQDEAHAETSREGSSISIEGGPASLNQIKQIQSGSIPVAKKKGRPRKGEERNKGEQVEKRASTNGKGKGVLSNSGQKEIESAAVSLAEAGMSGASVEGASLVKKKIVRLKKDREKNNSMAQALEASTSMGDASSTEGGRVVQTGKKRGRPRKGQEKKGSDQTTGKNSEGAAASTLGEETAQKDNQRPVKEAVDTTGEGNTIETNSQSNADEDEDDEMVDRSLLMVEEETIPVVSPLPSAKKTTGRKRKKEESKDVVVAAQGQLEVAEANDARLEGPYLQEEQMNWSISSLSDNPTPSANAEQLTTPLCEFPFKMDPASNKAELDIEKQVKMDVVVDQLRAMLVDGQGSFSKIDPYFPAHMTSNGTTRNTGKSFECYMGPVTGQSLQSIASHNGRSLADLVDDEGKQGCILNAGGYVYSVDWLPYNGKGKSDVQYLCISASNDEKPITLIGEKVAASSPSPARLQIWSVSITYETKLDMILSFDQGRISCVRWLPISKPVIEESDSILGILSACMQDGSVGIYAVPRLDSVNDNHNGGMVPVLKLSPLVTLQVNKGVPTSLDWINADKLAVAYSDGYVSIWSLAKCLERGSKRARPQIFTKVSSSPISCISWDSNGQQIYASAYDGSARCMQLAHPHLNTELHHSRDVCYTIEFSEALGTPLMERPESDEIRVVDFVNGKFYAPQLYCHLGRVRTLSLSPLHPFVASGGADGSVRVMNTGWERKSLKGKKHRNVNVVMNLFRLDRHRGNDSFRMIENLSFTPTTYQSQHQTNSTTAWDPDICITTTRWNLNNGKEGWLCSAIACGLVRIDVVSSP